MTWLALIQGTRSFSPDLVVYEARYEALHRHTLAAIAFAEVDVLSKDRTFWLFAKLASLAGISVSAWEAILAAMFATAVTYFVAFHSKAPLVSFVALTALGYTSMSGAALRQSMALSLTLIALHFVVIGSRRKAILVILAAALFHSSALIVLLAIPAVRISRLRTIWVVAASSVPIVVLFPELARFAIRSIGWTDSLAAYYSTNAALTWLLFAVHAAMAIACGWILRRKPADDADQQLTKLLILGLPFFALATIVAESFRLGLYFSIVEVVVLANAIAALHRPAQRLFAYLSALTVLVVYGAATGAAYV